MTYQKPPVTMPIPGPWPEREGRGGRSLSLDPITYVLPMKKKIILAIAAVVLLALGFLVGFMSRSDSPELKTKATQLDRYCHFMHLNLGYLLHDITTTGHTDEMHAASIVGIDNELSMADMHQLRPCVPESLVGNIPGLTFMCTKAFKNDDKCRIDALKKALDAFPEEYRGP